MDDLAFIQLHADLVGERNNIIIPKKYLELVQYDYVAAVVLRDIVAFTAWSHQKTDRNGWFYRNEKKWLEESGLSIRQVNRCIKKINDIAGEKVIDKNVRKIALEDGTMLNETATHYRLSGSAFENLWSSFGNDQNSSSQNDQNGSSQNDQNGQSLTKTEEGHQEGKSKDAVPDGTGTPDGDAGPEPSSTIVTDASPVRHSRTGPSPDALAVPSPSRSAGVRASRTPEPVEKPEKPKPEKPEPERVNGRLPWQIAKLTEAFYRAKGVPKAKITGAARGQANSKLKELDREYGEADVFGFVKYLETDGWWREPGRITPNVVATRLPEWAAKGKPEAMVPERAWRKSGKEEKRSRQEDMRSYVREQGMIEIEKMRGNG